MSYKVERRTKKFPETERGIYNDKNLNPPRRHDNLKCVCTRQLNCTICKANVIESKEERHKSTIIGKGFNTSLSQ